MLDGTEVLLDERWVRWRLAHRMPGRNVVTGTARQRLALLLDQAGYAVTPDQVFE